MARRTRFGLAVLAALVIMTALALLLIPPIYQDPQYHQFADERSIWGVPNFWNVASNAPYLVVAVFGLWSLLRRPRLLRDWDLAIHIVLALGLIAVAAGSSWYHLRPDSTTLFWDRLPMTLVFMSLLASMIRERISENIGRWLFLPLLGAGILSVLHWKFSGDLRFYAAIQFFPLVAVPVMALFFPPRYSGTIGIFLMCGLYTVAKLLEMSDRVIAVFVATGGHPWKHLISALAILCYMAAVSRRQPIDT